MNRRSFAFFLSAFAAVAVRAAAAESLPPDISAAFRSAKRFMVYSLDPSSFRQGTGFHGFRVIGYTVVEDAVARERIATATEQHVRAGDAGALCFNPRRGIRLISRRTIHDLVICYECGHLEIHSTGLPRRRVAISGKPIDFDAVLAAAKIPIARSRQ